MTILKVTLAMLLLAGCNATAPQPGADPTTSTETGVENEAAAAGAPTIVESAPEVVQALDGTVPAAGTAPSAPGQSCDAAIGRAAADALVKRCLAVSPATRPPCNVANACAMIQDEIDRSCAMFDGDKPAECSAPTATAG
jgi:hypothetical protein